MMLGLWKANPKMMQADQGAKEKAPSARKQGAENRVRAHWVYLGKCGIVQRRSRRLYKLLKLIASATSDKVSRS